MTDLLHVLRMHIVSEASEFLPEPLVCETLQAVYAKWNADKFDDVPRLGMPCIFSWHIQTVEAQAHGEVQRPGGSGPRSGLNG